MNKSGCNTNDATMRHNDICQKGTATATQLLRELNFRKYYYYIRK